MMVYQGSTVLNGIAIGKLFIYRKKSVRVHRIHIENTEDEVKRFREAKRITAGQLKELEKQAANEVGKASAEIFAAHQLLLEDSDYLGSIEAMIRTQQVNAEYSVALTADRLAEAFSLIKDAYIKERTADVRDISERIISVLNDTAPDAAYIPEPVIILAGDLSPSETIRLDKSKVLSFVTVNGSANSHTAILARTMDIPSLFGVPIELRQDFDGREAIVDGFTGTLYVDPDEETMQRMRQKQTEDKAKRKLLKDYRGKENITLDGKRINLYANIGSLQDIPAAIKNGAGGIGLFRSEFLYLEKDSYPSEEEQFQVYKAAAEAMAGKKVIIRTLDIGADKTKDYFNLEKEENPAMGYRAIRICLDRKDIFKTQLRAILRAGVFGSVAVMYPMIISVDEILEIKRVVAEVKKELAGQKLSYADIEQGIMIETPAAAMISDLLAKESDFFSIGTNDLTQYSLAIDRQNAKLDRIYDACHPAIFRFIKMVIENAHTAGIPVGLCGELGANTGLTETLLRMGIDELSVSPAFILEVRKKIRETNLSSALS